MNSIISVEHLTFAYSKRAPVINGLSFHVPRGSIFGFLGANGSGKTTTIRLMLGLCRPSGGRIRLNGFDVRHLPAAAYANIGALIEHPSLYGNLTAFENLQINARYYRIDPGRIPPVLDLVGLSHAKAQKVGSFSLGMKQRLGLALSLLHDPEVLILDEPLNGLDPKGISEIRELLLTLGREAGKTLFISSHLLGEIESTCDRICIIDKGRNLFVGTIDALRNSLVKQKRYALRCDRPAEACKLADDTLNPCLSDDGKSVMLQTDDEERLPELVCRLSDHCIRVYTLCPLQNSLENMYLTLTH